MFLSAWQRDDALLLFQEHEFSGLSEWAGLSRIALRDRLKPVVVDPAGDVFCIPLRRFEPGVLNPVDERLEFLAKKVVDLEDDVAVKR